jgi:hypothetical protein
MFKNGLLRSALALIAFLTACGRMLPTASVPQALPSPGENWTIKLTQSGGIAGVMQTLEVSSSGQLKAADQRSGRTVSQSLPPATLAELKRLFSKASLAAATPTHSSCADCFIYDLQVTAGGNKMTVRADDTTLADSGAAELIGFLRQLRDHALQSAP